MFSELPKLFDRHYVVAYFLPVSLFVIASAYLWGYWSKVQVVLTGSTQFDAALVAFNATLVVFGAWIMGLLLMLLNGDIYRFLEGYGTYNPLQVFRKSIQAGYVAKRNRLEKLDELYDKPEFTPALRKERTELMKQLAKSYPDDKDLVLPSSFGNTLRAFEVYSRVMYGLEGIAGWSRILTVVPKEYRELIDDAKTQVDGWINLSVVSLAFLIEFWIFVFSTWGISPGWFLTALNVLIPLVIFGLLNWFFLRRATSAAMGWGDHVKSVYDIYRFKLLDLTGMKIPTDRNEEKALWKTYSQAILYREPDQLPDLREQPNISIDSEDKR